MPMRHVAAPARCVEALMHMLNLGVFVLHTVPVGPCGWPCPRHRAGWSAQERTLAYLPARRRAVVRRHGRTVLDGAQGRLRAALLGAIGLILVVQIALGLLFASGSTPSLMVMAVVLFVFFCGFNALEATRARPWSRAWHPPTCAAA